jgi:signal transduction histidine kinase
MVTAGQAGGQTPVPPVPNLPLPSQRIWRLRALVLASVMTAFLIELVARSDVTGALTSRSLSFFALVLLCGTALFLIYMLEGRHFLKGMILVATGVLLLAQGLNVARQANFALPGQILSWSESRNLEGLFLLTGVVLMLTTYYFALLENVVVAGALSRERLELYREIAERKQAQAALNKSRDRLRQLSAHIENVREEERTKVAREIHDELGQSLTGFKIDLANLKRQILSSPADTQKHVEFIGVLSGQVDATMQDVRRIATELRPSILDELGLRAAVEWFVKDFEKRTGIACTMQLELPDKDLDRIKVSALFRIVQEALTNVIRHARATHVDLRLTTQNGDVSLEVADNGCGMAELPSGQKRRTYGILGIQERATQLGGDLRVESGVGAGTRIAVNIPIVNAQDSEAAGDGENKW